MFQVLRTHTDRRRRRTLMPDPARARPGPVAASRPARGRESTGAVVPCPLCGQAVPYPVVVRDGSLSLAECVECDLYFEAGNRRHQANETAPGSTGQERHRGADHPPESPRIPCRPASP